MKVEASVEKFEIVTSGMKETIHYHIKCVSGSSEWVIRHRRKSFELLERDVNIHQPLT